MTLSRAVVIIGAGFSGLAAAVALSARGVKVIVLERRNHLGGRAYSFLDSNTGDVIDNGQHLFMGCYRHTIAFLNRIGCLDRLQFQERCRIDFLDRDGFSTFACPPLPAPFHVLGGLLAMKGLSISEKLRALSVGLAARKPSRPGQDKDRNHATVSQWLDSLGQSQRMKERFWNPMAIATLNEDPNIASAQMIKVVLKEAFGGTQVDTRIGISRVGLSDLYTQAAREYVEARGGQVRSGVQVEKIAFEAGRAAAVKLKGGEEIGADYLISAVPPHAFLAMLPDDVRAARFAQLEGLSTSPIVSINLWFDRPVIDREFVGLIGTRTQWLFNKDLIVRPAKQSNQIAIIISAAHKFVDWTKTELVEMALSELHELIPESCSAALVRSVIVKERDATLSHTVASDDLRPDQGTEIPNLILAGDWVNTGLPATIESAVVSGDNAAAIVCSAP